MTSRWKHLLMAALLSLGFLAGCNTDNNQNQDENNVPNEEENGDRPDENDNETHTDDLDTEEEKGEDLQFDKDRGPDE